MALSAPAQTICSGLSTHCLSPCPLCSQQYRAVTGSSWAAPLAREVQVKPCYGEPVPSSCSSVSALGPAWREAPLLLSGFSSWSRAADGQVIYLHVLCAALNWSSLGSRSNPALLGSPLPRQGKLRRIVIHVSERKSIKPNSICSIYHSKTPPQHQPCKPAWVSAASPSCPAAGTLQNAAVGSEDTSLPAPTSRHTTTQEDRREAQGQHCHPRVPAPTPADAHTSPLGHVHSRSCSQALNSPGRDCTAMGPTGRPGSEAVSSWYGRHLGAADPQCWGMCPTVRGLTAPHRSPQQPPPSQLWARRGTWLLFLSRTIQMAGGL